MSNRYDHLLAELSQRLSSDPGLPQESPTVSYWQTPPADGVATHQSPQLPDKTDVAVIGSGITGCSVAHHLLQNDDSIKVTVLEARTITSGATGRNGGHIKAVPEFSYTELLSTLGKEMTDEVLDFTLANVEELIEVTATLPADLQKQSEVRRVESLNLCTNEQALSEVANLAKAYDEGHTKRGRLVDKEELKRKYGVHNAAGAYLCPAAAGWPYRLITGLFREMLQLYQGRFNLEAKTPALSIEYHTGTSLPYQIKTPRGTVQAKQVVHATNGHAGKLLPGLRGALFPVRGQMTAQSPTEEFGVQGGRQSWSINYGTGFDYMTQSGQSGEIFIGGGLLQAGQCGIGELGNVNDDVNNVLSRAHLGGIINSVFSNGLQDAASAGVIASWTGIMGFTSDILPIVGQLPKETTNRDGEGEWIAAGYNGYGMPNAWLCGKYVANKLLRKEEPGLMPRAYRVSAERLKSMGSEKAAKHWLATLGLD